MVRARSEAVTKKVLVCGQLVIPETDDLPVRRLHAAVERLVRRRYHLPHDILLRQWPRLPYLPMDPFSTRSPISYGFSSCPIPKGVYRLFRGKGINSGFCESC
jgi:hypothetical protein